MTFEPVRGHQCEVGEVYLAVAVDVAGQSCSAISNLRAVEYDGVNLGISVAVVLEDNCVAADSRVDLVGRVVGDSESPAGC